MDSSRFRSAAATEAAEEEAAGWVTVEEWAGSSAAALSRTAVLTASPSSSLASRRFGSRWGRVGGRLLGAFVPEGFPGSVTPDYVPFQMWDTLQGLSTYIRAMLSTQALLGAIGVGEKSATVIGATFQWFLRDLTGMLGGILFTFYQGSNLDSNAKMWRLVADFMNDLGMLMDLLSPLFPSSLIVIMCLGSLSRSFTGVASGATRAALTQHFALANNAADISAKEGSQETLATMLGMGLGMLLAHVTRGHALGVWVSFLSLTIFHMYANYKAVQSLSLTTLNYERSSILLQYFMDNGEVLTPQQVSKQEHILPYWSSWRKFLRIKLPHEHVHLGAKASRLTHPDLLQIAKTRPYYRNENYFLLDKEGSVHIFIHKQAAATDILMSFIHGLVLAHLMQKSKSGHAEARQWIDEKYNTFISKLMKNEDSTHLPVVYDTKLRWEKSDP
ncbi:protein root UVB sensitive 3 isoform X2 [Oryza sativa Japonica Group]|uniref:protein root UVB sensitive 3 isoform X2 n=1 Tax=Oryza sativa subsp. japonica TaxID=39947 RepID=UPI0007754DC4|nr:protein root UVB sensitive 3 isoform X2 [Oryza sativa Japonica Group]XP_025880041.1 protein root UVB sensitive 3 isoform X2 [Oryza sativa Japonica Group]